MTVSTNSEGSMMKAYSSRRHRGGGWMSGTGSKACLHGFTLELASREHIKQVSMPSGPGNCLLIQGYLGELEEITLTEGVLLEIRGSYGVLSIDLLEDELRLLKADGKQTERPGEEA